MVLSIDIWYTIRNPNLSHSHDPLSTVRTFGYPDVVKHPSKAALPKDIWISPQRRPVITELLRTYLLWVKGVVNVEIVESLWGDCGEIVGRLWGVCKVVIQPSLPLREWTGWT